MPPHTRRGKLWLGALTAAPFLGFGVLMAAWGALILLFFGGIIAMPIYWWLNVWKAPAAATGARA